MTDLKNVVFFFGGSIADHPLFELIEGLGVVGLQHQIALFVEPNLNSAFASSIAFARSTGFARNIAIARNIAVAGLLSGFRCDKEVCAGRVVRHAFGLVCPDLDQLRCFGNGFVGIAWFCFIGRLVALEFRFGWDFQLDPLLVKRPLESF